MDSIKKFFNKIKQHIIKNEKIYTYILCGIFVITIGILFVLLTRFPILPQKYLWILIPLLVLIAGGLLYLQISKRPKAKSKLIGKIAIGFLAIMIMVANIYILRTEMFLRNVSGGNVKIDTISLVVLKDSSYQKLEDVIDQPIGMEDDEEHFTLKAIADIQEEHKKTLNTKGYEHYDALVQGLYDHDVEAMFLNEAYRSIIEDNKPTFSEDTRVIYSIDIETLVDLGKGVPVTTSPFTVYISGIDTYGEIAKTSRSDVNILVTVNPVTKVILMTTTPRDSYVPLGCIKGNPRDKLTHAGNYGIDCSIKTLERMFDEDINYYVRVNFSSVEKIVDAIGGVEVEATHTFVSNDGYRYTKGLNYLNGPQALSFARDRYHQPNGDEDRGKNQMRVITSMINKIISPAIITNYMNILSAVQNDFQTSLSYDEIMALGNMQLNDMAKWTIISNNVTGTYGMSPSYAMGGQLLSMFYPNSQSVKHASDLIDQVKAGTLTEQPEQKEFKPEPPPVVNQPQRPKEEKPVEQPKPEEIKPEVTVPEKSKDNKLKGLSLTDNNGATLSFSPGFNGDTKSYSVTVQEVATSVTVAATASDGKAKILSGTGTHTLVVGANTIAITVEAEDGSKNTYTITVTKPKTETPGPETGGGEEEPGTGGEQGTNPEDNSEPGSEDGTGQNP